jgi:hypothetical protein
MAVTSAPHRGGHAAHRGQLALTAGLAAVVVLAVTGLVLVIRGGGPPGTGTQGSGIAATQTRTVGHFSGLDLAGSSPVTVVVSAPSPWSCTRTATCLVTSRPGSCPEP